MISLISFFFANMLFTQALSVRLLVTLIVADSIVLALKLFGVLS
jgi:hypothetical protein